LQWNWKKKSKVMQISGFLILPINEYVDVCISVIGTDKSDYINQLIQLSVIQISGNHCSRKFLFSWISALHFPWFPLPYELLYWSMLPLQINAYIVQSNSIYKSLLHRCFAKTRFIRISNFCLLKKSIWDVCPST